MILFIRLHLVYIRLIFLFLERQSHYLFIVLDQSGSYDGDSGGYGQGGARRPPPPPRKDREDKVHDSIIEERIQRERPCRTLFIRNIKASFRVQWRKPLNSYCVSMKLIVTMCVARSKNMGTSRRFLI